MLDSICSKYSGSLFFQLGSSLSYSMGLLHRSSLVLFQNFPVNSLSKKSKLDTGELWFYEELH